MKMKGDNVATTQPHIGCGVKNMHCCHHVNYKLVPSFDLRIILTCLNEPKHLVTLWNETLTSI